MSTLSQDQLFIEGYLLKQSDWLCTWKRRYVKLYTSGRLRCFNKDPGDQADFLVRPPWHRTLFIDENEINVTADVNVLGSRVYGHHLGARCNTAQESPTFRLVIGTPAGRYQFGMEEEHVWRFWLQALHVLMGPQVARSARTDSEEAIVTSSASQPGSSSQSSSACCEETLNALANDEEKAEQGKGEQEGNEDKKEQEEEKTIEEQREESKQQEEQAEKLDVG
ncbi:unnamed protein product [Effrenium voratum]|nr:unnamed protein product [Effrenium voratum]